MLRHVDSIQQGLAPDPADAEAPPEQPSARKLSHLDAQRPHRTVSPPRRSVADRTDRYRAAIDVALCIGVVLVLVMSLYLLIFG